MGKYRAGEANSTADCALDTSVNFENVYRLCEGGPWPSPCSEEEIHARRG